MRTQRVILTLAAFIAGLVGTFDGVVINIMVSAYHDAQRLLGGSADPSHGVIGFVVCLVGLLGAIVTLRSPIIGALLLAIAGIAFFFVVHWWALLASPQFLIAAVLAYMARSDVPAEDTPRHRARTPQPAT